MSFLTRILVALLFFVIGMTVYSRFKTSPRPTTTRARLLWIVLLTCIAGVVAMSDMVWDRLQ
jgi:cytochrome bd-type quinol oxidase subunit 1